MEGHRRFIVNIAEIGSSGLVCPPHPDPEHIISPFCRINFAQGFRLLQTECLEHEDEPNWSTTFSFMFDTFQDLSQLSLAISAYDRNDPEPIYLGKAVIDLHTIATGPQSQDVQLERQVGSPAGRVVFIVEMIEFCPNLICCISNVELMIERFAAPSPPERARLEVLFSERQDIRHRSETFDVHDCLKIRCQGFEPLPISASLVNLESAFVYVVVLVADVAGDDESIWVEAGKCLLPLLRYHPANTGLQLFREDLVCQNGHDRIHITGTVLFVNGPTLAQMSHGLNTERGGAVLETVDRMGGLRCCRGVSRAGGMVRRSGPSQLSRYDHVHAQDATIFEYGVKSSSICWRSPAIPYDKSDLLAIGKQRKWTADGDLQTVPRGWSLSVDNEGCVFFRYHPTKQTTWSDPRFLPPGWDQSITLDGKLFFYSYAAKSSTWIDPRGLPLQWDLILESGGHLVKPMFAYRGMVTTIDPRGLPSRYSQHIDRHGVVYFKDHQTKTTFWDDPRASMTSSECLQIVEDSIDVFNQARLKVIKNEVSLRKLSGPAEGILARMDNEVARFRSWYESNERKWLLEKQQREDDDRKRIAQAEQKLIALRRKNAEVLAKLEDKWRQEIEDKREAVLAKHEFGEQELINSVNELKMQIDSDLLQWIEDMIEMKKFAIRDQIQQCAKARNLLHQQLLDTTTPKPDE